MKLGVIFELTLEMTLSLRERLAVDDHVSCAIRNSRCTELPDLDCDLSKSFSFFFFLILDTWGGPA